MKNLLFFFFVVLLSSCNQIVDYTDKIDISSVEQVKSNKNSVYQREVYLKLNKYEKHYIWNERIEYFLKRDISKEQQRLLLELKASISPDLFEMSDDNRMKVRNLERSWGKKAFEVFPRDDLYYAFGTLDSPTLIHSNLRMTAGRSCQCNGDSWFDCSACNPQDPCDTTNSGCGFLFYFSCNQSCTIPPRPIP